MSIFKKAKKLFRDPGLFFYDYNMKKKAKESLKINNKHKHYVAHSTYTIVSAVYNVEKYLDDFFTSIINQSIGFEKSIFLIMVDDGSTDNSANIIKRYQKLYPENIMLLHKENGGQASARNLGLKYVKTPWVTFCDPDDFLDKNFFKNIDKIILEPNLEYIGVNSLLFFEKTNTYSSHPLEKLKFERKDQKIKINNLKKEIFTSTVSIFKNELIKKYSIFFDERINIFEDMKFSLKYISILDKNSYLVPLSNAVYYIRKRKDDSSTMNSLFDDLNKIPNIIKFGVLDTIEETKISIAEFAAYSLVLPILKKLINKNISDKSLKVELNNLLHAFFKLISIDTIMNYTHPSNDWLIKYSAISYFKNLQEPCNIAYIKKYDPYQREIYIEYFSREQNTDEMFLVKNNPQIITHKKISSIKVLDNIILHNIGIWIRIDDKIDGECTFFVNNKQLMLGWKKYSIPASFINNNLTQKKEDIWLFIDRENEADDNAERFYEYAMTLKPDNIYFALSKKSIDWQRLKKRNFNLIDINSEQFDKILKDCKYFISSHAPGNFGLKLSSNQKFIFLGHGLDFVDVSEWFNKLDISLRTSSLVDEYNYELQENSSYKLTSKELSLTGMARWDKLIKLDNNLETKNILIMPTWRQYLVEEKNKDNKRDLVGSFIDSEYYKNWFSFINSTELKQLIEQFGYSITFVPHFNMLKILDILQLPSYIKIGGRINGISFQENFINSSIMITDYTSAASEMAVLGKPIIYFQFDKEYFFSNHSYQQGWFNYENNDFSHTVYTQNELLEKLQNILSKKINKKHSKLFYLADGKCCERIYESILKLDSIVEIDLQSYLYQKIIQTFKNKYLHHTYLYLKYYINNNFAMSTKLQVIFSITCKMNNMKDKYFEHKDLKKLHTNIEFFLDNPNSDLIIKKYYQNKELEKIINVIKNKENIIYHNTSEMYYININKNALLESLKFDKIDFIFSILDKKGVK